MDDLHFDTLIRQLTPALTRRGLGPLATLGLSGLLAPDAAEARKKKPCPPCKKRKQGKCGKKLPDGTACRGGACQNGRCISAICVPNCSPDNPCGPDGCGGSCGTCTGGTCPAGVCFCPSGKEPCQGECRDACSADAMRLPGYCNCCYVNGTARDVGLSTCVATCCSGKCDPNPSGSGFVCAERPLCDPCTFDEQCIEGAVCRGNRCVGATGSTLCP